MIFKISIQKIGLVPECLSSGRLWKISDHENVQKFYEKFSPVYFLIKILKFVNFFFTPYEFLIA